MNSKFAAIFVLLAFALKSPHILAQDSTKNHVFETGFGIQRTAKFGFYQSNFNNLSYGEKLDSTAFGPYVKVHFGFEREWFFSKLSLGGRYSNQALSTVENYYHETDYNRTSYKDSSWTIGAEGAFGVTFFQDPNILIKPRLGVSFNINHRGLNHLTELTYYSNQENGEVTEDLHFKDESMVYQIQARPSLVFTKSKIRVELIYYYPLFYSEYGTFSGQGTIPIAYSGGYKRTNSTDGMVKVKNNFELLVAYLF